MPLLDVPHMVQRTMAGGYRSARNTINGAALTVFRSSWAAERGFCTTCGCHVFHRPQDGPEMAVSAGLFDDRDFSITRELCRDAKPPFYRFEAISERQRSAWLAAAWLPRLIARRFRRWLGRGAA